MATAEPDLIDRIDDLLDPEPIPALLLGTRHCAWITLPRRDPIAAITAQLGDSAADRIRQTRTVEFWVGANSAHTGDLNPCAGAIVNATLRAMGDGSYLTNTAERRHAHRVRASGYQAVIHGPCVVTGLTDGDAVDRLPDRYRTWFTDLLTGLRAGASAERAALALLALGVGVTVVALYLEWTFLGVHDRKLR